MGIDLRKKLEQNIIWFALGMISVGATSAIAFYSWLNSRIDEQIRLQITPEKVRELVREQAQHPGVLLNTHVVESVARQLSTEHREELRGVPGIVSCRVQAVAHPAPAICQRSEVRLGGSCKCDNNIYLTSGGYPVENGFVCNNYCTTGSWDWSQGATAYAVCCMKASSTR